jgi:DNA-binding winged helix-turn-helix (wHTH) protein
MRYVFGDYTLDTNRYELRRAGTPVSLGPKPFALLTYLLQHRDRAVAKEELLVQLWPQQFVSESVLTSCMLVVRQALGDSGQAQQLIKTVRGRGYRFMLPVEEQTEPEGALAPVSSVPQVTPPVPEQHQLTGLAPQLLGPPALCTPLDSLPGVPFDFPPRQTLTSRAHTLPGHLHEESLALRRALGDLHGIAECLEGLADVAVAQQHLHQAAQLLGAAEALRAKIGAPLSPREQTRVARHVSTVRARLGDAAFGAAWAAGQMT